MGSDFSIDINFPAKCDRAFVCASLGLFLIAFIDGLVSLVRECLGVVPRDDMEVDSSISGINKRLFEMNNGGIEFVNGEQHRYLRVNSHLAFERRSHLEFGADGDNARNLEAQAERGNTCPQSVTARILGERD